MFIYNRSKQQRGVAVEEFYEFIKMYPVHKYDKGDVILQQNEKPRGAFAVKSGIVKIYNLTVHGEEKVIALNQKNEIFPLSWVFSDSELGHYFYEALTDCELYVLPAKDYLKFLKASPASLYEIFSKFADHEIDYQMRINALEQSKATDKVLHTLHYLIHRFGRGVGLDAVEIQVPFTQQDMANFIGIARETTAIELKKLERKGVISYKHRSYIIQIAKLKELLGRDYQDDQLGLPSFIKLRAKIHLKLQQAANGKNYQ